MHLNAAGRVDAMLLNPFCQNELDEANAGVSNEEMANRLVCDRMMCITSQCKMPFHLRNSGSDEMASVLFREIM